MFLSAIPLNMDYTLFYHSTIGFALFFSFSLIVFSQLFIFGLNSNAAR